MSLLTIVQTVCAELALAQPAAVATSTDRQVQQLMALANRAGLMLARDYPWQALREEQDFVTVAAVAQPAALPADFDRFITGTFYNRSTRRMVQGPLTPAQWQWIQAQPVYSTVYLAYNERRGSFMFAPEPPAGQTIAYEYVSLNWAKSAAGAGQPAFIADTDTSYLDETLIQLGLKWRFLQSKNLDYAEAMSDYEREIEKAKARDGGAAIIMAAPQEYDPSRVNLPDGSFGM